MEFSRKFTVHTIIMTLLAASAVTIFMIKTNYVSRENDTRLYNKFVKQLAQKPFKHVVAPKWNSTTPYAEKETPYFRDNPPGQLIIPVILTKLGFPPSHALYFTNICIRLLTLWIILYLSLLYLPLEKALFIPLLIQVIPINLTYQLRANHEHAILLFNLLALIAVVEFKKYPSRSWILITISILGAFFIKGLAFIPLTLAILFYVLFNYKNRVKNLIFFFIIFLFLLLLCYILEHLFAQVTNGASFFSKYLGEQIYNRSIRASSIFSFKEKVSSLIYYLSRTISYTVPFSLGLVYLYIKQRRNIFKENLKENPFAYFIISYLVIFSLTSRIASRYIYPVYFLLTVFCLIEILRVIKLKKLMKIKVIYLNSAIYLLFTVVAMISIWGSRLNYLKYDH